MFDELIEFAEELEEHMEKTERLKRKQRKQKANNALQQWLASTPEKEAELAQKQNDENGEEAKPDSKPKPPPLTENDEILFW